MHSISRQNYATQQEFEKALWQMYADDADEYLQQRGNSKDFPITKEDLYPILQDVLGSAGSPPGAYLLTDLAVAKWINRSGVKHVYDIGSRLDGFITHLLAMEIQVTMLDIRPFPYKIEGLSFIQANAMEGLNELEDNSIEVLTSLCAFEHFGLGRYGDPIDYYGWKKAIYGVKKKLAAGGRFYLWVPIGKQNRLQFNAHRIFRPATIIEAVAPELEIELFSVIHSGATSIKNYIFSGGGGKNLSEKIEEITENCLSQYDNGIFVFRKDQATK